MKNANAHLINSKHIVNKGRVCSKYTNSKSAVNTREMAKHCINNWRVCSVFPLYFMV